MRGNGECFSDWTPTCRSILFSVTTQVYRSTKRFPEEDIFMPTFILNPVLFPSLPT